MDTRTICLGVLTWGDATGYEIKKAIEENYGRFLEVGHSSIYPALAELHRDGLVTCTEVRQDGKPDKKVYSLSEEGRRAFVDGLMRSPGRHKVRSEFVALMLHAEFLPLARVRQLLDERIAEFAAIHEYASRALEQDECDSAGSRFAAGMAATMASAGRRYVEENRGWLEQALAADGADSSSESSAGASSGASQEGEQ